MLAATVDVGKMVEEATWGGLVQKGDCGTAWLRNVLREGVQRGEVICVSGVRDVAITSSNFQVF